MKTLVLANHKGGVGKSAVATLLAHHFARIGKRVLVIDLDHQGNLSKTLRISKRPALAEIGASRLFSEAGPPPIPDAAFVVVPADPELLLLERQAAQHSPFARNMRALLLAMDARFDCCIVDTNPNPDIRVIAALASADFVLSPIQLNQEALDGVHMLLNHPRVGIQKIRAVLNPKLHFIGLLPTLVEPTPFQRTNFKLLAERYMKLMIPLSEQTGHFGSLPRRSAIAEAQCAGEPIWEMKKTAARDTWREIEPTIDRLAQIVFAMAPTAEVTRAVVS